MKNKYIVAIYKGLVDGEGIRKIHKRLYDETINQKKLGFATSDKMLNVALKSVNQLKKKEGGLAFMSGYVKTTYGSLVDDSSPLEIAGIFAFDLIHKLKIEKKISKPITDETDRTEGENKKRAINDNIDKNRKLVIPKIFYLASWHKDSATDHKDYQGKIYVDEKWKSIISDKDLKNKIEHFISRNGIKSIQWVTNKPVWFITRPNCRHYFMELDTEETLNNSRTSLLEKYKMETAIGDRQYLQTIRHSISKKWYDEVRNAELLLQKYKERLRLHKDLFAINPNKILKDAIKKDLMLIRKWEKYIAEKRQKEKKD